MKAVIMAGGKGTRLRPLTCHVPKPMVPLAGRPCMEYIIELLKQHGIGEIAVTIQYLPDVIRDHFGDGQAHGVSLHYFEETAPLGTAGSVKNAQEFLDEPFVVISGDALTDFDLSAAVAFHKEKGALATLVLTPVEHPLEYGVVMAGEDGRVVRFLEKPGWGEVFSDTVNTGIYILEPEVLDRFEAGIEYDFSNQLFPSLLSEGLPLYAYVADGYWSDIGSLQQYRQTQFDMLDGRAKVRIRGREIAPGVFAEGSVSVSPDASLRGPAYLGDGTEVEDGAEIGEYCILGRGNKVARGTVLSRTVLWDHNRVAEGSELLGSTLASRIVCREAARLSDGSVVGSHCIIGPKAVVHPGVKIWPKKSIGENTQLNASLIWGDAARSSLYRSGSVSGTPNVEITPEFAARFATAYGSVLAAGRALTVSSSEDGFAEVMKDAATAAFRSVGVHVINLGVVLPPVARFAVRQLSTAGGIHIRLSEDGSRCTFECFDGTGLPLTRSAERKVDNAFWQEDYGRAPHEAVGSYHEDDSLSGLYVQSVAGSTALESQPDCLAPLRVAVAARADVFRLLHPLLRALACEPIHLPEAAQRGQLASLVPRLEADLGLWVDSDGRGMGLVTAEGTPVTGDRLTLLQYLSFFHSYPGSAIGAPVSAPQLLESLAAGLGCRVVRTKENLRSIMEVSEAMALHPLYDALFAAGLVLRNLHRSGAALHGLLGLIPSVYLQRETVDCPWDRKGQVMRRMMERTRGRRVELIDGIKFYDDGGWVLLLPDSDEPHFNVVAQGEHEAHAAELLERYRDHILNFLQ
ncbi:sugar phosphate nucleotidyltransferase [Paenibacillus mucilaginosus]|uniref:Probable mannose-1-phosphate guanyltransferase n=1 Tax=Paenibacillus mucilaginosus (strain KNP414) TaxID=1036673 RepID=F8FR96_PAEMK|nr:sugar phosphate nucleotidyltransferase [Paenibacillus mucilaginosus]AEI39346.1 probable mannose-1-phosphate guanyltransferase [Paenibacillus mucilaginosus KNP414]MCG7216952.1 NTP transferase domain-containing protein [Paenibacillus mucilaginosus]WDM28337.1 NTP transferase domain-containing protein [Paenibacillus mucilaginosus]